MVPLDFETAEGEVGPATTARAAEGRLKRGALRDRSTIDSRVAGKLIS
jgi:hypothetical protein